MEPVKIIAINAKELLEKVRKTQEPVKDQDPMSAWKYFGDWLFKPYYPLSDFSLDGVDVTPATYELNYKVTYDAGFTALAKKVDRGTLELLTELHKEIANPWISKSFAREIIPI